MTQGVSAVEYHERTKHSPRSVRSDSHRLDFSNKPRSDKRYRDVPTQPLASALRPSQQPTLRTVADRTPADAAEPVDLDAVTQLCYYAAGITRRIRRQGREHHFRAAACTGALYHVDLYLVAGDLPDLPAGVYHFDPLTLSLDVLRRGDYRGVLGQAIGDDQAVAEAPLSFVATSTWWRNSWKYRARTYRHAFWDSGTVLANLATIAASLGHATQVTIGFVDDAVAALLGIDPETEAPLEVVPVGTGDSVPSPVPVSPLDLATEPLSSRPKSYDLITNAYAASSLTDAASVEQWRAAAARADAVGKRSPGEGRRVQLAPVDDAAASKVPTHRTIARRGSCRAYERATLNFRKVSTVLDRATWGGPMDARRDESVALRFIDCYLVANDVESVPDGAYHYHPDDGELECLREGRFRQEAGHLALDQQLAADAGVCAFFLADLDAVTERLGDRGYRVAQLEAALAAGRLYLAAYAHRDLGATGLTFYDDAVTEFFSPRAAGQTPMFLWTMGQPR